MNIIEQLKPEIKYLFEEGEGVHDWDHTLRVYNLAMHIGKLENADLEILGISALLHDIGRPLEASLRESRVERETRRIPKKNTKLRESMIENLKFKKEQKTENENEPCHAEIGAVIAEGILENYNFDSKKIEDIKYCIESHRWSKGNEPKTKEAKVLYDADKLDSIGAIGIARAFNFSGTYNARVHNPEINSEDVRPMSREDTAYQYYHIKLKKIKKKLFTDEAKKIAESRDKYMKDFFNQLNAECLGDK